MATLISLAQSIETDYQGDIVGSVKVCRPLMSSAIGAGNLPYIREVIGVPESSEAGIVYGYFLVVAQTNLSGDNSILEVGCVYESDDVNSYTLTIEGRNTLDIYKSTYRPFSTENDNLLTHVINYFTNTRGLVFIKKLDIEIGTPVWGHVKGQKIVGDGGASQTESASETWIFRATYGAGGWGGAGNIVSWKE